MADEKRQQIVVPLHGISSGVNQTRALHTEITNKIIDNLGGEKSIIRASNVEPGSGLSDEARKHHGRELSPEEANSWFADLMPVGGPVLGPYSSRNEALAAEERWLHENHIPTCRPCADAPDGSA